MPRACPYFTAAQYSQLDQTKFVTTTNDFLSHATVYSLRNTRGLQSKEALHSCCQERDDVLVSSPFLMLLVAATDSIDYKSLIRLGLFELHVCDADCTSAISDCTTDPTQRPTSFSHHHILTNITSSSQSKPSRSDQDSSRNDTNDNKSCRPVHHARKSLRL